MCDRDRVCDLLREILAVRETTGDGDCASARATELELGRGVDESDRDAVTLILLDGELEILAVGEAVILAVAELVILAVADGDDDATDATREIVTEATPLTLSNEFTTTVI